MCLRVCWYAEDQIEYYSADDLQDAERILAILQEHDRRMRIRSLGDVEKRIGGRWRNILCDIEQDGTYHFD